MNINPKKLILDTVHKSLILFLENSNLDQKIKLASNLLKKFNENSQMEKTKKLKTLIILRTLKSDFLIKNKFLNLWINNKNKFDFHLDINKIDETDSYKKRINCNNIYETAKKTYFVSKENNANNVIFNNCEALNKSYSYENVSEIKTEKGKESEKNELQESKTYNDTNNSLKKSKRLQLG